MPPYEWGMMSTPYSPRPDISVGQKTTNWSGLLNNSTVQVSMIDNERQQEIDNFYKASEHKYMFYFLITL